MVSRETLYEVYVHERTGVQFGLGQAGEDFGVVEHSKGILCPRVVSTMAGLSLTASKLKAGYTKTSGRRYFHSSTGAFSYVHEELGRDGQEWLLAATPPNMAEGIEAIASSASVAVPAAIYPEEIDLWRQRQAENSTYLIAHADHCLWALVLAEQALSLGWPLRAAPKHPGLPDAPPSIAPTEWAQWLSKSFSGTKIRECQVALGRTFDHVITSGMPTSDEDNLSAYI